MSIIDLWRSGFTPSAAPRADVDDPVVALDDVAAADPERTGAKASVLARANAAGLPVLPGFVVTTALTAHYADGVSADEEAALRAAWCELTAGGSRAVVVRSSSVVEDGGVSSMAGLFTSQLDVRGWDSFLDAVTDVLSSAKSVPGVESAPMTVLVQPMLAPRFGGVLFGIDPVTGRRDRRVVVAVEGGPDRLVSGEVDGARYLLSRRGRALSTERPLPGLGRAERKALANLARRTATVFGSPQDVEWAIDDDGRLLLLQSRPVTATGGTDAVASPVLGPGPVAETFPDALSVLEEDLWVPPLREAIVHALRLTGTATNRAIARSPVVATVAGRVAVDLELFGGAPRTRSWLRRLNPVPPARRLLAAWRVGRLRAALPDLAADVITGTDEQLLEVPGVVELTNVELVSVLRNTRGLLRALHGHEMLAGLLVTGEETTVTGAEVALWVLQQGRAAGRSDADIVARDPVVLDLVPPRITAAPKLPSAPSRPVPEPTAERDDLAILREALRVRVRWVQELTARAAWELGARLSGDGRLGRRDDVRDLTVDELAATVAGDFVPVRLVNERRDRPPAAPLPAAFRLTRNGEVVAAANGHREHDGVAVAGGRVVGPVHITGDGPPPAGAVLVVRTLDPELAALLPQLGGLVAETGSALSHLAILAREFGVPTVVGVDGATERFRLGSRVLVDGGTGEVRAIEPEIGEPDHDTGGAA